MDLSIKNPEAHRLAKAIADETGETLTQVVLDSLRERHERLARRKGRASAEELMAIAKQVSKGLRRPRIDHGELLYDKYGLPK
jgi:antitoxin VapB